MNIYINILTQRLYLIQGQFELLQGVGNKHVSEQWTTTLTTEQQLPKIVSAVILSTPPGGIAGCERWGGMWPYSGRYNLIFGHGLVWVPNFAQTPIKIKKFQMLVEIKMCVTSFTFTYPPLVRAPQPANSDFVLNCHTGVTHLDAQKALVLPTGSPTIWI